jgi:acyl carrier protein
MGREPHPLGAESVTRGELLRKLAAQLEWPDLQESTSLGDDPRWDSVAQLDVLMLLQRDLSIAVSADQLQSSQTMGQVLDRALEAES